MYKQTVTYEDFDDNVVEETLHFSINKIELMENLDIRDAAEEIQARFEGKGDSELSPDDIRDLLNLVKRLTKLAYGVRESSKKFVKNEQIWEDFKSSPAYEAFLFSLFEDPQKAVAFMSGVMPRSLRDAVANEMKDIQKIASTSTSSDETVKQGRTLPSRSAVEQMSPEERRNLMAGLTSDEIAMIYRS